MISFDIKSGLAETKEIASHFAPESRLGVLRIRSNTHQVFLMLEEKDAQEIRDHCARIVEKFGEQRRADDKRKLEDLRRIGDAHSSIPSPDGGDS